MLKDIQVANGTPMFSDQNYCIGDVYLSHFGQKNHSGCAWGTTRSTAFAT